LRVPHRHESEKTEMRVVDPQGERFVPREKPMRSRTTRILWLLLFLCASGGCAGITGTEPTAGSPHMRAKAVRTDAVQRARTSLQAAKAAGCEFSAPFEYYMAQEYLHLAEYELVAGDKDGVVGFAEKSNVHSIKAIEMAKGEKK